MILFKFMMVIYTQCPISWHNPNKYRIVRIIQLIMTSANKRKQLVNELRKAHFPFGFENNKGVQSQYIEKYKEYEAMMQQKSENAKKVNFSVTDPNGNTNYQSQFKERYPGYEPGPRDDPMKHKKSQVDKNFIFGYDPNSFDTNYKDDYNKKQGNMDRVKPVNQRQPHINLGDSLTDFATTYNQVHNQKEPSRVHAGDPQMIRKSNMILGNDKPNFETQNNATYVQMPLSNYHITQRSNVSSINLGGDANAFKSEHKQNFAHKDAVAQPVDKERIRDFRSAHFHFGFPDSTQNLSENKAQYNEKPIDYKKVEGNRASNLDFNIDGKNYFDSTYSNQFVGQNGQRRPLMKKGGEIDSVMMGATNDPNQYTSQARAQFGAKEGTFQRSKASKPVGSLDIGKGNGEYLTHNQDIYQDKFGQRENSKLSPADLNKLKGINFQTGFQIGDYGLSSQAYGKGTGPANKLSKDLLDSMKNANIPDGGDNPFKGGTTYKASYHWKKGEQN